MDVLLPVTTRCHSFAQQTGCLHVFSEASAEWFLVQKNISNLMAVLTNSHSCSASLKKKKKTQKIRHFHAENGRRLEQEESFASKKVEDTD